MGKYRKKPVVIDAMQWFAHGDHDAVEPFMAKYRGYPDTCERCHQSGLIHGWVDTLEGGHIVCPGDWIITGVAGEHYPCKPDIFVATYEPAEKADES